MDVYNTVRASILKFCNDLCEDNGYDTFEPVDFDAQATFESWPDADLIGVAEYSITNTQEQYDVTLMIGVSSKADDVNMERMLPVVGKLFETLVPAYKGMRIVNPSDGSDLGNMVVMGDVQVMPAARTSTRPIILVAVHLSSAFLSPP